MAGLREALAAVRSVVAQLAPTSTTGSEAFTIIDGMLSIEREPGIADRTFEVRAAGVPEPTDHLAPDECEFKAPFVILVRYDANRDLADIDDRMAEDAEQITIAVEADAARASHVRIIQKTNSPADSASESGDFVLRTLTFDCTYRRAL